MEPRKKKYKSVIGISISIKNSYDEKNRIIKKEFSNGLQEKYYYVSEESELVGKK